MVLAMSRPWKHPTTGVYYFRKAVPDDLRLKVGRREEKRSLKTRDPNLAKTLHAEVAVQVERRWAALRAPERSLSDREAVALAGAWYAELVGPFEDNQLDPVIWDLVRGQFSFDSADPRLAEEMAPIVDKLLAERGLNVDAVSRKTLAAAVQAASQQAISHLKRRAGGDYRPDPDADRFPKWQETRAPVQSLSDLFVRWASERKPPKKTEYAWSRTIKEFESFASITDAAKITRPDVLRWKDHLLAAGRSPKTVQAGKLAPVQAVLQWAVDNLILTTNPATAIRVLGKAPLDAKKRGYSDEEARLILTTAAASNKHYQRWVPWLCAYSGARIAEVCQLRKEDIVEDRGVWCLHIRADAGSVKNAGSERKVPLHDTLIDRGFLAFVRSRGPGPIFTDLKPDRFGNRGGNGTKLLGRWVRDKLGITDPRIQPNHAWRHRFKTLCRQFGVPKDVHDAITGHGAANEGDRYGEFPIEAMASAIARLPPL